MEEFKSMIPVLIAGLLSFVLSMLLAPLIVRVMSGIKAGQPILKYLEHHSEKSGIPTMGGWIFILPAAAVTLAFGAGQLALIALLSTLGYGIVGFLDDFIKVRYKRSEGLKPYQKVIGQLGIAVIVTYFAYINEWVGDAVKLPFFSFELNLGWLFLPLSLFIFIAATNSVNLTDGLDGLAGSSGAVTMLVLAVSGAVYYFEAAHYGMTALSRELLSLSVFAAAFSFSLLGFLWKNSSPAKIIMGDTGSLALGGGIASVAIFLRNPFLVAIIGVVYIWSSISVILQVIFFKLTGKRIFKMAPFHHHLELKGYSEKKITSFYTLITAAAGAVGIISVILNLS